MQLISLEQVFKILKPDVPLPFGVRDASGRLLLAKGLVVGDQTRLMSLLNRGMYVDAEDVKSHVRPRSSSSASRTQANVAEKHSVQRFTTTWNLLQNDLGVLLREPGAPDFLKKVREAAVQVLEFPEEINDQILFLILRHDHSKTEQYAEAHALHVAALCNLVGRRLGLPNEQRYSLIGAALTMNLSVMNLQARLASHSGRLNPAQRKSIDAHPLDSALLLRTAGLQDANWLVAVEQHHEVPGGGGYPMREKEPTELSQMLRLMDTFSAKHSARAGRAQQPAQKAARDLYAQSGGSPVVAALIKECGIYPPGTYVRLASGELAIVTRRGANVKEPQVAAITHASGEPLTHPLTRDTSEPVRAIVDTVPDKDVRVMVSAHQLYD
jgi:HD-GYP domain-containing protein (c-di-GMP phosphodiesterase class II)